MDHTGSEGLSSLFFVCSFFSRGTAAQAKACYSAMLLRSATLLDTFVSSLQ